ncbi:MAG: hypothetical protein AAFQ85_10645 [Pseudomonadota bacterium]
MLRQLTCAGALICFIAACSGSQSPETAFFNSVSALCGKAYEGEIVSQDKIDDAWRSERIVMHVRDCSASQIRIPLHVGENRSRTWVLSETGETLSLRHDHRHRDGAPDALTQYGGLADRVSVIRAEFPADASTQTLFEVQQIPESMTNTWALEADPKADVFAYEMSREGRFFRIEFDLSNPVAEPPAPWGMEKSEG